MANMIGVAIKYYVLSLRAHESLVQMNALINSDVWNRVGPLFPIRAERQA